MKAPEWIAAQANFTLKLMNVRHPPYVRRADESCFKMVRNHLGIVIAIVKSIEGPQDIELQLEMVLYVHGVINRISVSKIFMYVSEYSF